ncbi:retrovirus-related Pol polyprotein from transposon opus [Trichonephila clavipes]|nr:retrovirus-related Pol polyprotein from transposon opus [Trichonephila clavipes]
MNISHTGIMSALDRRLGYFQMAVNPSDIVKTAFVTKNSTYAFRRMPFGLSGAASNFQKAIDIILKPVIGKFVNVYMDDVIISSPSFTQHVEHLKEVFRLLHEAGLTLNKDKCKFGCEELKYLGLIINKKGIQTEETKVQAIVEMKPPRNSKAMSKFLRMSQCKRLGIRHVKTVVYRPQANRTERVNRDLLQMIANYVNEQHDTWDQFLREFAYAIRTAVNETTGKIPAELFLGRKLVTPFQKLVMVSDRTEFAVGDTERLFEEARRNTKTKHEKWEKYYNRHRRDVQIKVRIYRHRKCDETEIGTSNSDNGSLRDESSGFDRVQRRSNESRDGKKKGSEVKRELKEKELSFLEMIKKEKDRKKVTPTTSGYNLRPRNGKGVESRPTIERKTQQEGPVRSRKGRGRNDSPYYIEEQTRSSNKNARRGGDQQRQDQERRGACTKSLCPWRS